MEYLMTYGWAILIIAVVLGALFSLGVFSGANLLGNACIAQSGFYCQNPIYSHSNGNIIVTLGQNTGTNWAGANFVFVPQGTPSTTGVPGVNFATNPPANIAYTFIGAGNTITSGQTISGLYLPVNGLTAMPNVGVSATGSIWAIYQTVGSSTPQYIQIATINIKAS